MGKRDIFIGDREPGERKATTRQLDFLRDLADIPEQDLQELGIQQASDLISALAEARDRGMAAKVKAASSVGGCGCWMIVIFVGVMAIIWAISR